MESLNGKEAEKVILICSDCEKPCGGLGQHIICFDCQNKTIYAQDSERTRLETALREKEKEVERLYAELRESHNLISKCRGFFNESSAAYKFDEVLINFLNRGWLKAKQALASTEGKEKI